MIRVANGQGFWGDWLEAPVRLVEQGPIDYLGLDYLAEVTMSILQKQRAKDPNLGYARDFPPLIARIAKTIQQRGVKVVANAGGVNPRACAEEVRRLAPGLKVAIVVGDEIFDDLDRILAQGQPLKNMDTGEPLSTIREHVLSANVYLGAFPLAEALQTGADVVISGRCSDTALALAPMIAEFNWPQEDYNRLAAGTVAGHVLECGTQVTGGNSQVNWQSMPDMDEVGYPIVEAEPDGRFIVTKHAGTGGLVNSHVVKEQLLYELGDPKNYIGPDCIADFTTIQLEDVAPHRVQVSGVRGAAPTPFLKASISYHWGWKAVGTLVYSWPDALEKAKAADAIARRRLNSLGLQFDAIHTEFLGANACHGPLAKAVDPPEVQLRIGVRDKNRAAVERFTRELIPLVLSGPPGATGYGDGRPSVSQIVAYWPALIPRELITPRIEVIE